MQKGYQSKIWMRPHLYQRTLSLPVMSGHSYLNTQQWGWPPLYQCSFSKGSHERFYHLKRGNGKAVFTFSKEYVTGGAVSTTFIIPIMDALCPGYRGTISEPFRQSRNGIGSITDSFRCFYHLNHTSALKEVSVLYLLFQSLLLLRTSPLSCSIKGLDTL